MIAIQKRARPDWATNVIRSPIQASQSGRLQGREGCVFHRSSRIVRVPPRFGSARTCSTAFAISAFENAGAAVAS